MSPLPLPSPPPAGRLLLHRCAVLVAMLILAQAALASEANPQAARKRYDIAVLPLDMALSRFSEISGIDVLLREPVASRRRSSPVRGELTPPEALGVLLQGSGLIARFTSVRSAIIVPAERANEPWIAASGQAGTDRALLNLDTMRVTAPRTIGNRRAGGSDDAFAQRLVVVIRRFVMERGIFEGGKGADLRIATRIGPDGALYDVRVVLGSRDRALDARVRALLEGANLGLRPPLDLRQPLLFDVSGR